MQQIRVGLVPLRGLVGVGLLVDRHQAHEAHQSSNPLLIHQMAFVAQVPGHLADAEERRFQELFVDLTHQVQRRLALGLIVE